MYKFHLWLNKVLINLINKVISGQYLYLTDLKTDKYIIGILKLDAACSGTIVVVRFHLSMLLKLIL